MAQAVFSGGTCCTCCCGIWRLRQGQHGLGKRRAAAVARQAGHQGERCMCSVDWPWVLFFGRCEFAESRSEARLEVLLISMVVPDMHGGAGNVATGLSTPGHTPRRARSYRRCLDKDSLSLNTVELCFASVSGSVRSQLYEHNCGACTLTFGRAWKSSLESLDGSARRSSKCRMRSREAINT